MDLFFFQLAMVFLPGLIWARLDARYAMKEKPNETELLVRALMYGLATYTAVYLVYQLLGRPFSAVEVSGTDKPTLMLGQFVDEILVSIPVSIVLATLWVAATSHKLLTRMLQRVGATKKYGDEDVWDFMFNSSNVAAKFVHFRDFDKMLVYAG